MQEIEPFSAEGSVAVGLGQASAQRGEVGVNKKYKIAVMGATGVGKTVFFGSYFNLVTNLGRGSRPIMVKSQSSVNRITELITQLFQKHEVVQGTSERVDFSFSVDSLGMEVELFDIPRSEEHTSELQSR